MNHMIIEFIGSTGAGKTTLIKEIQRRMAKTEQVTTCVDLAASMLGIQGVTNPTVQNIILELVGLPFFIGSLNRYKEFIQYTVKLFLRNFRFSITAINNLRSLERKIGGYEISSRYGKDRIIFVDEGPLLAAHMFVFTGAAYTPEEIARFVELLPLPDLVVYVRASVETLIHRTIRRGDPPREINKNNLTQTKDYVNRAVAMFDQLIEFQNIRSRLLIVESPDFTEQGYDQVVDDILSFILEHRFPAHPDDKL
jgi:deoxyadenosine/deoxycytidine kinase